MTTITTGYKFQIGHKVTADLSFLDYSGETVKRFESGRVERRRMRRGYAGQVYAEYLITGQPMGNWISERQLRGEA